MTSSDEQQLLRAWGEHQRGKVDVALGEYQAVLQRNPEIPNGWCYLGIALHDKKQYQLAVDAYRNAIRLQPVFPVSWNNMGNSLRYLSEFDQAEEAFAKALQQKPDYANAYKNRAALRATQGDIYFACEDYAKAKSIQPNDPELHRNIGVLKLLLGEFEEGWTEYRWRWHCKEALAIQSPQPKWDGSSLDGKRIFLYAEQGLGDTIQFIRYANILKEQGASRVLVFAQSALAPLLRQTPGVDRWYDDFMPVDEPYDVHCSLIDCADLLKTNLSNIPDTAPYIKPSSYLVKYWADYFKQFSNNKLRIGLAWQGNRDHQADQFRSMKLSYLRPMLEQFDAEYFALQQGFGLEQVSRENLTQRIHCFPESTDKSSGAFMDTAAIMSHLDLVITTDTSIAHLSAAIGRPTWVLLNVLPDWRWLLDRTDSPWYSSIRLFRQAKAGDWDAVVSAVTADLRTCFKID